MTRHQRLVLVSCILATAVVLVDSTVVNVALPAIERDLGGGLAGQQWTSNAYLLTLGSLLLIGGSLGDLFGERRVFSAGVIGFGLTSVLCARGAHHRGAGGRTRPSGRGRCAAHPGRAGGDREHLPGRPARAGHRRLDGLGGHRRGARAAGRRPDRGQRLVAVDLRHQRAAAAGHAGPDQPRHEGPGAHRAGQGGRDRRSAVRHRAGRDDLRPDRAAAEGVRRPAGVRPAGGGCAAVRGLPGLREPRPGADASAGPVQAAQLRDRQRRDPDHVRRPRAAVLLPDPVPPAGGGVLARWRRAPRPCR